MSSAPRQTPLPLRPGTLPSALAQVCAGWSETRRRVVDLRFAAWVPQAEIARRLGLRAETIRQELAAAVNDVALARLLEEDLAA